MAKKEKKLDPLYQLFEHFLVSRSYDDSTAFAKQLAEQYIAYLDSTPAHLPFENRATVLEDLEVEARELLVKKMYGMVRVEDYINSGTVMEVCNEEGEEITKMKFELPVPIEESEPAKKRKGAGSSGR